MWIFFFGTGFFLERMLRVFVAVWADYWQVCYENQFYNVEGSETRSRSIYLTKWPRKIQNNNLVWQVLLHVPNIPLSHPSLPKTNKLNQQPVKKNNLPNFPYSIDPQRSNRIPNPKFHNNAPQSTSPMSTALPKI